jgi:hypothetical protein
MQERKVWTWVVGAALQYRSREDRAMRTAAQNTVRRHIRFAMRRKKTQVLCLERRAPPGPILGPIGGRSFGVYTKR